jgi:hypothetical protein
MGSSFPRYRADAGIDVIAAALDVFLQLELSIVNIISICYDILAVNRTASAF